MGTLGGPFELNWTNSKPLVNWDRRGAASRYFAPPPHGLKIAVYAADLELIAATELVTGLAGAPFCPSTMSSEATSTRLRPRSLA